MISIIAPRHSRPIVCGICFALLVVTGGCSDRAMTMAGGKSASYWIKAAKDPVAKSRKLAVFKLGNVADADPGAFPAILEALDDADHAVRAEAIIALMKFGDRARDAIPTLRRLHQTDEAESVRTYASRALESIASRTVTRR